MAKENSFFHNILPNFFRYYCEKVQLVGRGEDKGAIQQLNFQIYGYNWQNN